MNNSYISELVYQGDLLSAKQQIDIQYETESSNSLILIGKINERNENLNLALQNLNQALTTSSVENKLEIQMQALTALANIHIKNGNIDKAQQCLNKCKGLSEKNRHLLKNNISNVQVEYFLNAAKICYYQGEIAESRKLVIESLSLAKLQTFQYAIIHSQLLLSKISRYQCHWDKAMKYALLAKKLAEKLEYKQEILISSREISQIYWRTGDTQRSLEIINKCLEMGKTLSCKKQLSQCYLIKGIILSDKGEIDRAIHYHQKAIDIAHEIDDKETEAKINNNLGAFLAMRGELDSALEHYFAALRLYENLNHLVRKPTPLTNIGFIFENQGNLTKAIDYHNQSYEISQRLGRTKGVAESFHNLGRVYYRKGKNQQSLDFIQRSLELRITLANKIWISESLYLLFQINLELQRDDKARGILEDLQGLDAEDNKIIELRVKLARALYLKKLGKIKFRMEAAEIFEEIVNQPVIRFYLTATAIINLCDLTLDEYKAIRNSHILDLSVSLINKLYKYAQSQNSAVLMIVTLMLRAKLSLLTQDGKKARIFLSQAKFTADENGLVHYSTVVQTAIDKMENEIQIWQKALDAVDYNKNNQIEDVQEYLKEIGKVFGTSK